MDRFSRAAMFSMLSFAAVGQAVAAPLDDLQGAWTTAMTSCADTFEKVDGKIDFKDRQASVTSGLIISGNKITAPMATCTVEKIRQQEGYFSAYLRCDDSVMFSDMSVSFQLVDAKTFKRFESDFPDLSATYSKCEF